MPLEDQEIIRLYQARSEAAITASEQRYGAYLRAIALRILGDAGDAAECVNDVWLKAWTQIPQQAPEQLPAYLARLTRGLAIDRWRRRSSEKRGGGELPVCLDELSECIPAPSSVEDTVERKELARVLRGFVQTLEPTQRAVFVSRYWYFDSAPEIAARFGFSRVKVRSMLHRTRKQLKSYLKECGYFDETL